MALAGGGTPAPVYRALAEDRDIDWRRWQLFFGDERTVPPDHPDSNYRMVRATLIDNLPIQPLVLRVPAEADPEAAADSCASTVRKMVPGNRAPSASTRPLRHDPAGHGRRRPHGQPLSPHPGAA
ncbi:MAG: 6-phosphogluconolactonase [Caldilineaceae bacterium]